TALSENTSNIPKSFFASHISNQSLIILSLLSISQYLLRQFDISASSSCSNSITSKIPQFRASQIRTSVSMLSSTSVCQSGLWAYVHLSSCLCLGSVVSVFSLYQNSCYPTSISWHNSHQFRLG